MSTKLVIARLKALLPKLEHGRETHVQWRDCAQVYHDNNPQIGDRRHHTLMVEEYDERIATINEAVTILMDKTLTKLAIVIIGFNATGACLVWLALQIF